MTDKLKNINFLFSAQIKVSILLLAVTLVSFSQYSYESSSGHEFKTGKLKLFTNKAPQDDENKILNKFNHQFSLSASGGFLLPIGDLKGDVNTISLTNGVTSAQSYFEKMGYSYGLSAKMKIDKHNKARVTMSLIINNFINSGSDSSGKYTIEPELNFIQLGLGGEYAFARFNDLIPFIGIELNANSFFGQINFIDDSTSSTYSLKYAPVTRYGITIGAGADYYISSSWGVFAGVKFSASNLLGKNFDASGLHDLNDESYTLNGVSIKQKSIMHLAFYAGFTVFVGD